MTVQQLFFASGGFVCDGVDFDGTSDYMTRGADLTGNADSKTGIFSAWVTVGLTNGVAGNIFDGVTTVGGSTQRVSIGRDTANKWFFTIRNSAGTIILLANSVATYTQSATWLHILASWDLAATAFHLYTNDSEDAAVTTNTNDTIDYTLGDWGVAAIPNGATLWNGDMAEIYFAPGQYLDFSVTANRRKFISATGKPVYLGLAGALPTGTAPQAYFHLGRDEAVSNFALNRGLGGDFSITGTLTASATSPSD